MTVGHLKTASLQVRFGEEKDFVAVVLCEEVERESATCAQSCHDEFIVQGIVAEVFFLVRHVYAQPGSRDVCVKVGEV